MAEPPRDDPDAGPSIEALRRMNAELQNIRFALDESAIVATTDRNGVITRANRRFCEIAGYRAEELVGRTHRLINSGHHPRSFFTDLWGVISRGEVWRGDLCNRDKAGRLYWVATTIIPLVDEQGRPERYLAIRFDITARRAAEEGLRAANERLLEVNRKIIEDQASLLHREKLSSIGLLASGVAHEVNNPLAGAMNCLKMLRERVTPARRDAYLDAIGDALVRIQRIVRSLLDYARPQARSQAAVGLERLVTSCITLVSATVRRKQVQVQVQVPSGCAVEEDRSLLMQAIMNVLLNAIHAAPPRTDVCIDLASEPGAPELIGLRLSDRGPGIPAEHLGRVCDPFFSTKPEGEGTGLGLAITAGIMEALNGRLAIESTVGEGTSVTLWMVRS